jgi:Lrp/AsnC family transcriptional regulator, regulator for asnA, asnC and gidA
MLRTDDLDESILRSLREDGRISNREVARQLGISEGTVRHRLKRLEDARAIRIGAVVDPASLGMDAAANVMVAIDPARLSNALEVFSKVPGVDYVGAITGRFNVLVSIAAKNLAELRAVVSGSIERFEGVRAVEIRLMLRTLKPEWHVVAIPRT